MSRHFLRLERIVFPLAGAIAFIGTTCWAQSGGTDINNPYTTLAPITTPQPSVQNPYRSSDIIMPTPWGAYYYPNPYSGVADIINAQGSFMQSAEQSRIIREKAYQEYLKSVKMRVELRKWIESVTPSFTDKKREELKRLVERTLLAATNSEIWSGSAQNLLLNELIKLRAQDVKVKEFKLKPEILRQINVTVPNGGNLGILRDGGRIDWPLALTTLVDEKTRQEIELLATDLVNQAKTTGKVNQATLADLQKKVQEIDRRLNQPSTVNSMRVRDYLQADRFLDDLRAGIRALENSAAVRAHFEFQERAKSGMTVAELVEYMAQNGLRIGPSTEGDEAAYQALYSQLAGHLLAVNTQLAKRNGQGGQK